MTDKEEYKIRLRDVLTMTDKEEYGERKRPDEEKLLHHIKNCKNILYQIQTRIGKLAKEIEQILEVPLAVVYVDLIRLKTLIDKLLEVERDGQ
jgi:hypothetical protein